MDFLFLPFPLIVRHEKKRLFCSFVLIVSTVTDNLLAIDKAMAL